MLCVILAILLHGVTASLIASSEIKYCTKRKASYEPMLKNGEPCEKKFLVALAVRSGQVNKILHSSMCISIPILACTFIQCVMCA